MRASLLDEFLSMQPNRNQTPLLTPDEAAAWLRVTKGHLARLRVVGGGPLFVKLSRRCIAYRIEDLEAFVASRVRRSTSDEGR